MQYNLENRWLDVFLKKLTFTKNCNARRQRRRKRRRRKKKEEEEEKKKKKIFFLGVAIKYKQMNETVTYTLIVLLPAVLYRVFNLKVDRTLT
jgi:hypothetical protein